MQKVSLKGFSDCIRCITLLCFVFLGLGCAAEPVRFTGFDEWSTLFKDARRTNVAAESVGLPPDSEWRKDISPRFEFLKAYPPEQLSSPVISSGTLYVGSTNQRLYAYDLRRGKKRWRFDAAYPVESTPTVGRGMVCFGTAEGVLYCLDELSGKELFRFQALSEITSSPVISEGVVYFASSDNRVYALSAVTGRMLWNYHHTTVETVQLRTTASTAVTDRRLFHLFSDGVLVCLDLSSGRELWTKELIKDFLRALPARRTPMLRDGRVYVIDEKGSVVVLEASTGEVSAVFGSIKAVDFVVIDHTLIVAGTDKVAVIDMDRGTVVWEKDVPLGPIASVFSDKEHLFVLSNHESRLWGIKYFSRTHGYIQALSLSTGEIVWTKKLSATINSAGALSEDHLALFTDKGIIEVYVSD